MRRLACTLLLAGLASPALADESTGEVVAYDRVAHVLVLKDRTVWELPATLAVPEDLEAGDRVRIVYVSAGDAGVGRIVSITRAEPK